MAEQPGALPVTAISIEEIAGQPIIDGAIPAAPQPNTVGFRMCDRDIKFFTGVVAAASSFEDLKVNVSTLKQEDWNEVSLVGVYKDDGAGNMAPCVDQADADVNAVLSIWDYQAVDQADNTAKIQYDVRGGYFLVDGSLSLPKADHRVYVVAAPGIPAASGGQIRFFDGYLEPYEGSLTDTGKRMQALNPRAVLLDPTVVVAASVLRLYCFYPAGAKQTHIMRIVTYRPAGTF